MYMAGASSAAVKIGEITYDELPKEMLLTVVPSTRRM